VLLALCKWGDVGKGDRINMNIRSKIFSKLLAIVSGVVLVIVPSFTGTVVAHADDPIRVDGNVAYIEQSMALCSTHGALWTFDGGALTINLDAIAAATSDVNSVVIESSATGGDESGQRCKNEYTSLNIVQVNDNIQMLTIADGTFYQGKETSTVPALKSVTFPSGLLKVVIGDDAFRQFASTGAGDNTLESVQFAKGLKELKIGNNAFYQNADEGNNALKSITFPEGLERLVIGDGAFVQSASLGSNALTSVTFPLGLEVLEIESDAFYQWTGNGSGNNALTSVTFPLGLKSLIIGDQAFTQYSINGNNALTSATFPAGLTTLVIGSEAFGQRSNNGNNALKSVAFPDNIEDLSIEFAAFAQKAINGNNALENFIFGTDKAPGNGSDSVELEENITCLIVGEGSACTSTVPWTWIGEDNTDIETAWGANLTAASTKSYSLAKVATVPLYRLYNRVSGEHLYTKDAYEAYILPIEAPDWKSEGDAWVSPTFGKEVFRLYNPILGDHHYTADQHEIDVLTAEHGWVVEKQAWLSFGSQPLYRLYNPFAAVGSHHFTRDSNEATTLDHETDWQYEGVSWFGLM
jgi:hypothetical protein